jgi:bifunctional non-homologous end joining protein LigD
MKTQTISLYFKEGSSDKEYHASIEQQGDGYLVNFAYGRRGSTLQTGSKTNNPIDLETATQILNKLVNEKKAKGYSEGESGTPYQQTAKEERVTGVLPQLLNSIDEPEAQQLIADDNWCAQEKFDGKRVLIQKRGTAVIGINRKGLSIGLPLNIVSAAQAFKGDFLIDGEAVGEMFYAFDLLARGGHDWRQQPFRQRYTELMNLLASGQQRSIQLAATAWDSKAKTAMLTLLQCENREGIVFKRADAAYTQGRPNSGGPQLKHKFYATASVIVGKVNRQRSIEMKMLLGQEHIAVGNVTIPPNHSVPKPGQVVEVRYLYAFAASRCLYQPIFLGLRSDVLQTECLASQLKFKNGEEESLEA